MTLLLAFVFSIGLNNVAFASEVSTITDENTQQTTADQTAELEGLTNSIVEMVTEKAETEAADKIGLGDSESDQQEEEINPLDGYEVYIDEQGEVYYLEKEPESVVIEDKPEEEAEKIQVESMSADKTSDADKKVTKKEKKPSYSEKDLRLLASLIYAEAGNQSYQGMLAVGNVVINRMESSSYGHVNTIKEVIYDKKWAVQFAVTVKNKKTKLSMLDKALKAYDTGEYPGRNSAAEEKAMKRATKAAKAALEGENNIGTYLCFNAVNGSTYRIKKKYPNYKIIGDHIFYRTK